MDDRTRHAAAVDALLDKVNEMASRILMLEEELAFTQHQLMNCMESADA